MSLIAGILILAISTRIYKKWKEKRQTATLFLFISILAYGCACWCAMGIYATAEVALPLAIILQKITYSFVFGAGIGMFLFGTEVFFHFRSKLVRSLYFILGCALIVLVLILESVDVQYFGDDYGAYPLLSIKIEYSILLVLYLVPVLLGIAILAFRASKKLEDKVYAVGYRFIALGNILILATFVVDALSTASQGNYVEYAVFLNFTWIIPIIAAFCSYLGWTLPEWFRTFLEKK